MRVFELNVSSDKPVLREVASLMEAENLVPGMSYMRCTCLTCKNLNEVIMMIVNDDFTAFATEYECHEQINALADKFIKYATNESHILCNAVLCKLKCEEDDDYLLDLTDDEINSIISLIR